MGVLPALRDIVAEDLPGGHILWRCGERRESVGAVRCVDERTPNNRRDEGNAEKGERTGNRKTSLRAAHLVVVVEVADVALALRCARASPGGGEGNGRREDGESESVHRCGGRRRRGFREAVRCGL